MRAGRPNFYRDAEAAIRVVQDNDDAVAFGMTFARILERVILGDSAEQAIATVTQLLKVNGTGNTNDRFFAHGLDKMKEWRARPPFDVTLGNIECARLCNIECARLSRAFFTFRTQQSLISLSLSLTTPSLHPPLTTPSTLLRARPGL
jgi:hypothetical protein